MMPKKRARNAQGNGTIRKRSDGTWEARYTVGRDPGTGKQIQKSIYGKTQGEAAKKMRQKLAALDNGTHIEEKNISVSNWLDTWLEVYTRNLKPKTLKSYTEHVNNHLKPNLGARKINALSTTDIQSLYNKLLDGNKTKKGLSPKTIKNIHGVLHKAMEQAVMLRYLSTNPANACILPRTQKPEIHPLEDEDINRFVNAINGHRYERIALVGLYTGMRISEILGLTWDVIDADRGAITVNKQLQRNDGVYDFISLKNNKPRTITPAPTVFQILRKQRAIQNEWRLKAGSAWNNALNLVFTNEIGEHFAHFTVYRNIKNIFIKIGLPNARFHDLRHTYAVMSLRAGDDIKTVQENLGHHSAAFTLDVYGHITAEMKKESAKRMEQFIQSMKQGERK